MSRRSGRVKPEDKADSGSESEQDEVTRCICGKDEVSHVNQGLQQFVLQQLGSKIDTGLFIQCDSCSVWQHGCCVGLFVDDDVPDKYWCEQCKPELHLFVTDLESSAQRTLYRPVNDSRTALVEYVVAASKEKEKGEKGDKNASDKSASDSEKRPVRSRRSPADKDEVSSRQTRKDRRHGEDYDEQLQRALRESARASDKKRPGESNPASGSEKRSRSEESDNANAESAEDEEKARVQRVKPKPRAKPKPRPASKPKDPDASREELLRQPSKPRFVNDKSTIYELRKRTGAILEWLGRSHMELEEEQEAKRGQFKEALEGTGLMAQFDENLKLMEALTEKILVWEQKFGKYAP